MFYSVFKILGEFPIFLSFLSTWLVFFFTLIFISIHFLHGVMAYLDGFLIFLNYFLFKLLPLFWKLICALSHTSHQTIDFLYSLLHVFQYFRIDVEIRCSWISFNIIIIVGLILQSSWTCLNLSWSFSMTKIITSVPKWSY